MVGKMHGPTWRLVLLGLGFFGLISVILLRAPDAVCQTWCREIGNYVHCSDGSYWASMGNFRIREDGRNTTMFTRLGDTVYSTNVVPERNIFKSPLPLGIGLLTGDEPLGGSSSLVKRPK